MALATPSSWRGEWRHGTASTPDSFLGAKQFSYEPWGRFGDLFPLPLPGDHGYGGATRDLHSRRAQQRVLRRRKILQREEESIRALNQLAGFEKESEWPLFPKNMAQVESLKRVHLAHVGRAPPVLQEGCQAALQQLLKKKASSGYDEVPDGPGQLASYVRDRLSLPRGQGTPIELEELLPAKERDQLRDFAEHMLLSPEEMAAVQERGFENDCYYDPQLSNDPNHYHAFISDLHSCNLIRYTTSPRVQVGAFVVTKKQGKQRLIIDARRANKLFRTPPSTILGSVDSWSRLEVEEHHEIFLAQEDVKDYFYRLGIGEELSRFFALPEIDPIKLKRHLGYIPEELHCIMDNHSSPIYPCMKVLPMGFSWAFHLAHQAHVELARRCLLQVPLLQDQRVAPRLGGGDEHVQSCMLIYADNNNHIGIDRDRVQEEQDTMQRGLHEKGLDTHDICESSTLAESLGVRIHGITGQVQPTAARDWRLDRALKALEMRPVVTGEQLQVIVGHMTVRALIHRGLMGIMRYVYIFIEQSYEKKQRLWRSVAREISMFRRLMPLAIASMKSPWDHSMICTDACLTGYAVMESNHSSAISAEVGVHDERWRFKRQGGKDVAPRLRALDTSRVFEDVRTVKPEVDGEVFGEWEVDPSFPDVPFEYMNEEHWHLLWNTRIHFREPVHLIEARSVLGAMKHRCRDHRRHGKRLVVLNDNMSVILALQKGRCSSYPLLRLIRRVWAHSLASGIRLHPRRVPSERNVADKDSRKWETGCEKGRKAENRIERSEDSESLLKRGGKSGKQSNEEPRESRSAEEEGPKQVEIQEERRTLWDSTGIAASSVHSRSPKEEREGERKTEETCTEVESEQRSEGAPGGAQCEGGFKARLCKEAGGFLQFRKSVCPQAGHRGGPRRRPVRLCRSHVLEWREQRLREQIKGCLGVRETGGSKERRVEIAKVQEGLQGVEEVSPEPNQAPHAGVHQVLHIRHHDSPGVEDHGFVQRSDFLNLCTPWRDDESVCSRPGNQERALPVLSVGACPLREERGQQSGHIRRGAHPRRCESTVVGQDASLAVKGHVESPWGKCSNVGLQRQEFSGRVEGMRSVPRSGGAGKVTIPEQTWGCLKRSSDETSQHRLNSKARSVGSGQQCSHLRQARTFATDDQQIRQGVDELGRRRSAEFRALLPQWFGSSAKTAPQAHPRVFQGKKFLSLFGGVANPAKYFAKNGGLAAVVDFSFSPQNDLGKHSNWNDIDRNIAFFDALGIDIPCNTWSRARRAPWWSKMPKPIRALGAHIYGLPGLAEKDFKKVTSANVMLQRAAKVIRKCLRLGLVGYLENPASSMIWQTPEILRLLKDSRVQLIRLDMCMYHTQWKKPTKLLVWNVSNARFHTCQGRKFCSRTGKAHVQLTGFTGKRFATEQAQVYSQAFSAHLMQSLFSWIFLFFHPNYPPIP